MARIRQQFDPSCIADLEARLSEELSRKGRVDQIKPGQRVAIAVGSRGVAEIDRVTRITVEHVKRAGGLPMIIPAMGSHGGATAEGQTEVLAHLGVTEETVGAPVRASMDVVQVGALENGLPVYVDRIAAEEADAIIVINRVKPHTAFRGPVESGLVKMISIGLGKQKGADSTHQLGFGHMAENVPKMAGIIMQRLPIMFGVATVENAYDRVCHVEAIPAGEIMNREPELLKEAKRRMPRILIDQIDVLVVDQIGKNISGDGMDPNITGRFATPFATGGPDIARVVALDLTPETGGNATGVGEADITTQRVFDKMDRVATYANALTSTVIRPAMIAMVLPNDRYAIKAAVKTSTLLDFSNVRLVRIQDTLHLGEIEVSEAALTDARAHPDIEVLTEPAPMTFDADGNLFPFSPKQSE